MFCVFGHLDGSYVRVHMSEYDSQALPARLHCAAPDVVRAAVVSDVRKRADGGRVDVDDVV